MAKSNKWLCTYAVAQLGRPYKMGSAGKKIKSTQSKLKQKNHQATKTEYTNPNYGDDVKTHDCSGLIVGALTCTGVNKSPSKSSPVYHGASSMFKHNCKNKHTDMKDFDYIPGRIVFIKNTGKTKNKHPYSHVGIYVGTIKDEHGTHKNVVVEAMGRKFGVVYSKISKWDAWAQLSCCTEDTTKDMVFTATGASGGGIHINVNAIDPYVATIGPIKESIDYTVLKKAKVSAMMFNAGCLYDTSHKKKLYKNPYLPDQIKRCEEANMPFALYAVVRAHNEIEADAECGALYYVLADHPPKLGLWLRMDTGKSSEMNDKILNVYYKYIERWGFKNKCGIYIEKSKLSTISWSSYQDKFYLWAIDPMSSFSSVEGKLLQPSMFEVK